MDPDRIAKLLEPFLRSPVSAGAGAPGKEIPIDFYASISTYIDILRHWNARINLTAIRDPEQIVIRHFGESLFTARHLFGSQHDIAALGHAQRAINVADIGSGAGFPGLPVKLWNPAISLTLIEANLKKATFLREATRALKLNDVQVANVRAENMASAKFDIVTLRAVEQLADILSSALRLAGTSGRLALLVGKAQLAKIRSKLPTVDWNEPVAIPLSDSRVLLLSKEPG